MQRIPAKSPQAIQAYALVNRLQQRFVDALENLASSLNSQQSFTPEEWFRDEGTHGGGIRYGTADGDMIGRGSVNTSQVHYDDLPDKKLSSANALSTIIHPVHPHAPSVHIHISWTEMRNGDAYWRIMADLNPAIENPEATQQFLSALQTAAPDNYHEAVAQGGRYFFIPVLNRHRGVAHFYLEQYNTDDKTKDLALATSVGEAAIDTYVAILQHALTQPAHCSDADRAAQLAYHTVYFFQVLTLDRGTTTGLLVHNQNDIGILASLPAYVDKDLLASWMNDMPEPQEKLLESLIAVLPETSPCLIDDAVKQKLADVIRQHYRTHPGAIALQASGDVLPSTVNNHR
ncbi:MAG: coproporphyrinogen III oxidase [Mariprofundaceae bacterium]|nr:coproporphyrinogen III oxidase [Mariprofundaceae bacterium]